IDDETHRLADRLADPANREQQDRRGDRDENVIESGDQSKLLFIDRGRSALLVDVSAQAVGGLGADRTGCDGLVELILAIHVKSSLKPKPKGGVLFCQYSKTACTCPDGPSRE